MSSRSVASALGTAILAVVSVLVAHQLFQLVVDGGRRRRRRLPNDDGEDPAAPFAGKRQPVELSSREEWVATFPSLGGAFNNSSSSASSEGLIVVGILFAAGWCDDCQEFVPLLEQFNDLNQQGSDGGSDRASLAIVYVSSDRTKQDMARFKPNGWREMPFERVQERAQLKRHFGACAKKELDDSDLGMGPEDRRHGIPTLVLVEQLTGRVVSEDGVDMVARAVKDAMGDGGDSRMAIDRFWRDLSLLQEQ
jgi:thiol-disulfide isomerase/thioredoxin